ncbi:MAG: peptide/nickel transport system substrate-binding protein [Thermoleophilaceae bacterium]|nr:peptide/nickel transport system substrate-binding protein [Thermoleophilaceae bacterium]
MRSTRIAALLAVACVSAVAAGCGSSNDNKTSSSGGSASTTAPANAKKGGTLTMVSSGDVDNKLDPGYSYYQFDFILDNDLHRTLLRYKPNDTDKPSPDLAESEPTVSSDGKTITVKIRKGVKFSPPVNREVTSADVKYAMERDFLPAVGNGYAGAYWGDILGVDEYKAGKAKEISGITTPDDSTLVIKLKRPTASIVIGAMALPGTAPVPKEYAAKYDAGKQSQYGLYLVTTGPYMVQNNASGKVTGYQPGRKITMVRNPNWDKSTDWRPAYLDKIIVEEGNDPNVGNRKILNGQSMVANPPDLAPPPQFLKQNINGPKKDQLVQSPYTGRTRWVSLNTKVKPFDDINVRKAVFAALDRKAMNLAFGGETVGAIANHIIPPGVAGFDQAGGLAGPDLDFLKKPEGDPALAASYMKKAGFSSGKYNGPAILEVADNATNQKAAATVVLSTLKDLGFKVNFRPVTRDTMYSKYCGIPKSKTNICPSTGWLKDFADPQTMLDPTFNGKNIVPTNNSNWPQLDVPAINQAMDKAETVVGDDARAQAWADIDKMVTEQAAAIPWQWDKPYLVRSANVNPVLNKANAAWDLSSISLK